MHIFRVKCKKFSEFSRYFNQPKPNLRMERLQHLQAALDRRLARRVGDAEVGVAAAEDVAGDDEQLVLDRPRDEFAAGAAAGHFGEDVERPARLGDFVAGVARDRARTRSRRWR